MSQGSLDDMLNTRECDCIVIETCVILKSAYDMLCLLHADDPLHDNTHTLHAYNNLCNELL